MVRARSLTAWPTRARPYADPAPLAGCSPPLSRPPTLPPRPSSPRRCLRRCRSSMTASRPLQPPPLLLPPSAPSPQPLYLHCRRPRRRRAAASPFANDATASTAFPEGSQPTRLGNIDRRHAQAHEAATNAAADAAFVVGFLAAAAITLFGRRRARQRLRLGVERAMHDRHVVSRERLLSPRDHRPQLRTPRARVVVGGGRTLVDRR